MSKVTLISVDLAKDVFQVAVFTDRLKEVFNRQIKRKDLHCFMAQQPACEVVMEACCSSHYWARCFQEMWILGVRSVLPSTTSVVVVLM